MFTLCMHGMGRGRGEMEIIYPDLMELFHRLIQFVFGLKIMEGQHLTTEFSFSEFKNSPLLTECEISFKIEN